MNEKFIPVAVDINYLQHQKDTEGELFTKIVEQGHYAGRTKPTNTRQGLYVATADGTLLASINTTRSSEVMKMMNKAIRQWEKGGKDRNKKFAEENVPDKKFNLAFPEGGMILRETMRDLPRKQNPKHDTWRHNFDYAWLTKDEVAEFVPKDPKVGVSYEIPDPLVKRFAKFHLVDQVKGESAAWKDSGIKTASLQATVRRVENGKVQIQLNGNANCIQPATDEKNPYSGLPTNQERGVEIKIAGWLTYDTATDTFAEFRLLGFGDRWGTATYSFRHRDMQRSPIGFAFEMLPTKSENQTRPKFLFWDYFGRRAR